MKTRTAYIALFVSVSATAADELKLPYIDWGACPFECCTYREWETTKPVTARSKPSVDAEVLFRVPPHQPVSGITGVVITTKPGRTRILKAIKLGYSKDDQGPLLSLKPGEVIYTLHYLGEGYDLFWYQGKTYSDQCDVSESGFGEVPFAGDVKVESRPQTAWWVQFKDKKGRMGWTPVNDNFAHMDACE